MNTQYPLWIIYNALFGHQGPKFRHSRPEFLLLMMRSQGPRDSPGNL